MAVDIVERDGLEIGTPVTLFEINHPFTDEAPFDVAPDGKSFLVNQYDDQASEAFLTLIQNWTALLER